jgi:ubiquinone/menaquinone biosynthesis C-methylase UbiE
VKDYYDTNLAAERLRRAYELAPPRVRQYFEAEIAHVIGKLKVTDTVLELGCGFGRVLRRLAPHVGLIVGVDTSEASLLAAAESCEGIANIRFLRMNAEALGFAGGSFDKVICIQNGISAFHLDPIGWVKESVRVTKPGGLVLISSYSTKFWKDRLEWFRLQSENGLLGEIDWEATKNGALVCKDGFSATTYTPDMFTSLMSRVGFSYSLKEFDESSLFCEIRV